MEIPAALQPLIESARSNPPSLLKLMKPGQLLHARVESPPINNLAKLLVGNTELLAKTRLPLVQGEQLILRVEKGLPQPELKVLQTELKKASSEILRSAMSRQIPPKEVQQLLRQITTQQMPAQTQSQNQLQQLPNVQKILKVLVPTAPAAQQISANTVKQALLFSGIFFEPNLVQGKVPQQDQKLQLLQLLRLFTPQARASLHQRPTTEATDAKAESKQSGVDQLMNRLLRLVEGSLSRIQSHQAASLNREETNSLVWQFDLPLQIANKQQDLQLRIQQEDDENDPATGEKIWKVDIAFDFDNLGEVSSRINLSKEEVSAAFWCQEESTTALIEKNIPKLENALKEAGLSVKAISSLTGSPPQSQNTPETLLDERV